MYMDLEAGRKRSGVEDLYISYHAKDDVQATYAGALFHNGRNYHVSSSKNNVSSYLIFTFCGLHTSLSLHFIFPCSMHTINLHITSVMT